MAMKMLEAGGLKITTDGEREADADNPRGYYEDERVKDLAKATDKSWLRASRGRAVKVISFLLKDLPPNLNYRVIFMRRDLSEVLASQRKMLDRRGETDETPDERMIELWQDQLWRANYLLRHGPQFEWVELGVSGSAPGPGSRGGADQLVWSTGWTSGRWLVSWIRRCTGTGSEAKRAEHPSAACLSGR